MTVIDLTHTIRESMPVYPGTEPPKLTPVAIWETDHYKETLLHMYSHTGTHMDAPAHIFRDGLPLDRFPPEQFLGTALVIDCRSLKAGEPITMAQLQPYGDLANQADFLLFNTGWGRLWGTDAYFEDFPCADEEVLDHILSGRYKGIGFDTISLDPVGTIPRHRKLFSSRNLVILENLKDLHLCGSNLFRFICCPLKTENSDGAPIRALAWLD
jgi:kynurenine formamidase